MNKIIILLASTLVGCSTATTYKQAGDMGHAHGYEDVKLAEDLYHVTFTGNLEAKQSVVYAFFLQRSAEIAFEQGKDCFEVRNGRFKNRVDHIGWLSRSLPQYEGDVALIQDRCPASAFMVDKILGGDNGKRRTN